MGAGAATAAAAGIGIAFIPRKAKHETLSTVIGQMREIVLPDGSIVSLNTDSEISVAFSPTVRKICLLRGEALFDVAKNKARPFVVWAGGTQVRAVGKASVEATAAAGTGSGGGTGGGATAPLPAAKAAAGGAGRKRKGAPA